MAEHSTIEETRAFIAKQREALLNEREAIFAEQQVLQERLDAVNEVLAQFDIFEGKPSLQRQAPRPRAQQSRRGSKRDSIMAVLADTPHGLTRGEILEKLGLKGDKSGEMSVSNALTALTKGNQVVRKDGRYIASMG